MGNHKLKKNKRVTSTSPEWRRLKEDASRKKNWKRWGPYLAERQWGTVREDYSAKGEVWDYFTYEQAVSRAYRWGEDGILGITDRQCRLCFALTLWNEKDDILKERLYGLTGPQGNHGEDVKELYYYLDSTPTHSYFKALYKYPQNKFPYQQLIDENRRRSYLDAEYELWDTSLFDDNHYFDVFVEYAKGSPNDILIRIHLINRGPEEAPLHFLPTLWFRNTWIWGCEHEGCTLKPRIEKNNETSLKTDHEKLDRFIFAAEAGPDGESPDWLFTENETNTRRLWGKDNYTPYVKDAFHEYIIQGKKETINPDGVGTKAAAHYRLNIHPGEDITLQFRLFSEDERPKTYFGEEFKKTFQKLKNEADDFYAEIIPDRLSPAEKAVQRQAYAGMLWTKQFYHYSVKDWLQGDPEIATPPQSRWNGRNKNWQSNLFNRDVISMPDKWEYPWYAAWDLAFHMIPFARIDPNFAKEQLDLILREWYMHPNGQIPAYEFNFDDVNPPVHAWACWRIYKMTGPRGKRDVNFLARVFHKLLINFTWWVNLKDPQGNNLFSGGFLGLDNIGVFDRSKTFQMGGHLDQADGTAWMAFYCSTMLAIALELAHHDRTYENVASKFFEHFVAIADAINTLGGNGLWDEEDGFYYDELQIDGNMLPLRVRSMVGLVPLFAVGILDDSIINELPGFKKRMNWFLNHRKDLSRHISYMEHEAGDSGHYLLAIPSHQKLERVFRYLLNEDEFLSPYGVRSLSKIHENRPYTLSIGDDTHTVRYIPAESDSGLFGGNSNWRGPIWFPLNYLLIESLEIYHHYYGDSFKVECPVGSDRWLNLCEVSKELSKRLCSLFLPDHQGRRPSHGEVRQYADDPHFKKLILFYEYFHGDNGRGIGASHQTGWTGLVAKLLEDLGKEATSAHSSDEI